MSRKPTGQNKKVVFVSAVRKMSVVEVDEDNHEKGPEQRSLEKKITVQVST